MATLIRIKRPLANEPAENIVVKSKRQKLEGASEVEEEENILPTGVLKRVATITSKDDRLQPEVLQEIHSRCRTWEELRKVYKRPSIKDPGYKDVMKKQVQASATHSRLRIHALKRGNLEGGSEESSKLREEEKCNDTKTSEENEPKAGENSAMEQEHFKYYDAELPWTTDKDIITCNGVPLQTEKYVYDIYYSPAPIDWTEFVCEVERYDFLTNSDDEELPDDDDENDECNWRNDYPDEEEDNPYEDQEDYMNHMLGWRDKKYDTDESYDADEYNESDDFDEDGNLLQYGETNKLHSLHLHVSRMAVANDKDGDEETASKSGDSNSEYDGGDEMV